MQPVALPAADARRLEGTAGTPRCARILSARLLKRSESAVATVHRKMNMRFNPLSSLAAVSVLLFATGCANDITCPAWSFPAVLVHLESAIDGAALTGALGEVRQGTYRDSLQDLLDGSYMAAENRPGTYSVQLELADYLPWDTAGVFVEEVGGSCRTVNTEILEVKLEPVP
jgi:uncharacterized integral membrane protein